MASENIIEVTDENFDQAVKNAKLPVVLDFWAEWCPPCRQMAPVFEELAAEFKGKLVFGKVNVDQNGQTASSYSVRSIPTFIVFKDGAEIQRLVGGRDKATLKSELTKVTA